MANAVANSVVPKFTIIVGNSFGAGNYAMCGKADPSFMLAWPTAKMAVMGGNQASNVLLQTEKFLNKNSEKKIKDATKTTSHNKILKDYNKKSSVLYAASQLWVDAVIDPIDTRNWISMGIDVANHSQIEGKFNMGILQV